MKEDHQDVLREVIWESKANTGLCFCGWGNDCGLDVLADLVNEGFPGIRGGFQFLMPPFEQLP